MMEKFYKISALAAFLALVGISLQPVLAGSHLKPANVVNPRSGDGIVNILVPDEAVKNGHAIVPLGSALDNGRVVQGYAIVHYKNGHTHKGKEHGPGNGGGGKTPSDPAASCYGFLAKGARWKTTEHYVVDSGIDPAAVLRGLDAWDSRVAFDVFGSQDLAVLVDGADTSAPDYKNEIMFGNISEPGAIAVAIVWGIFYGNPAWREIVEYDVVFDNADYAWGNADEAGFDSASMMDFENIATHELGHAAGMADLYDSQCGEQTMYGYAKFGEVNKRTLEAGDINGVRELYK